MEENIKMSDSLKLLYEKLQQNEGMLAEVKKNPPKSIDDFIAIGERLGVELTADDLQPNNILMSDSFKLAFEKLTQNKELMEEVKKNPPRSAEEMIAIAKRLGVELTEDDLPPIRDLTEDELDMVAGGDKDSGDTAMAVVCSIFFGMFWVLRDLFGK